jgi:hypothetical protein
MAVTQPTNWQIIGLAKTDFHIDLIEYFPPDEDQPKQYYDFFLINLPGKSGMPSVRAEFRSRSAILETTGNLTVVYTNGESYIFASGYQTP